MAFRGQISSHIRRIENVEKNLKALSESVETKEEGKKSKTEMKKLYVSDLRIAPR